MHACLLDEVALTMESQLGKVDKELKAAQSLYVNVLGRVDCSTIFEFTVFFLLQKPGKMVSF